MQFGFRKNHSTETALCYFIEQIKSKLDGGGVVGAVFLDFRKAFDTVNHNVLLSKLSQLDFSTDALSWMESYLVSRKQCTRIIDTCSTLSNSAIGVPQGSILGPILFSLYINDLPLICSDVSMQMYADDTVLYVHAKTRQQAALKLTSALNKVSDWLTYNCLTLNVSKTVAMYFSIKRGDVNQQPDIFVKGEGIKTVDNFKYLGVIIDSNLSFKKQIKKTSKCVRASLANFRHIRHQLPLPAAKLFLHSMIFSHLSYCSTSWSQAGVTTIQPLATLYKMALKVLDKKPRRYHHCIIISKYNLLSFDSFICFADMCLMYKIINDLAPPPLKQCISLCRDKLRVSRSSVRGDCYGGYRKTSFGQSAFSVSAVKTWNVIPVHIRNSTSFNQFKRSLKTWLKADQRCDH